MGQAESQSKIGEETTLESLEQKLDEIKKALSSIGTDSWRVQTV
jgi:hypothetical protein